MDLNGYFDPVSLERPEFEYLDNNESFSHHITVNTPDHPIRELDKHQVALMGIPVDSNGFIKGSKDAPNHIRSKLYQLRKINRNLKIYDLGNVKNGLSINDTYFAVRDILLELREREITTIIFGGSQDLSRGVFLALEKHKGLHQLLTIDSMLDFSLNEDLLNSRNYLNQVVNNPGLKQFSLTNLGHQAYFVSENQLQQLDKSYLESIRLGEARKEIKQAEPLIRDSEFISIDMGAVRHADAPGASTPSPNGFFADELCQITRYAGLSEQTNIIGFFEFNPKSDINGQTAHLAAQASWYFLEGLTHRIRENPVDTPEHIKKFIVTLNAAGHDIIFHKSTLSERWWMEIPVKNPATGYNFFVSCSYEDYQHACNQEIPDRWWRFLQRLGNEKD
ncbi:MAG: formimidoylglutamase [Bacteroidales bacterium]|nr:formimidoylglutamase [Bacteroidales bacterium]